MTDYDAELSALREKLVRKSKVESMLGSLRAQMEDLKAEEERLAWALKSEQADVDRLEKGSLTSLFYAVINRKDEKLDQEKAEAYAAAVKHDAAVRQVEAVKYDIGSLETELSGLAGVEARYDRAFARKEAAIKNTDPKHAAEICRVEDRIGYLSAQKREIDEALAAGRDALAQITVIESELASAAGWGTWDLLGGGVISGLAKHAHLDEAQAQINALQATLRRYRTELSDVTVVADIRAQVEGLLRFADYFFDGLFADWAVLDSIHNSQGQIADTRWQVEGVQARLEDMKERLGAEAADLKSRLNDLVLKA